MVFPLPWVSAESSRVRQQSVILTLCFAKWEPYGVEEPDALRLSARSLAERWPFNFYGEDAHLLGRLICSASSRALEKTQEESPSSVRDHTPLASSKGHVICCLNARCTASLVVMACLVWFGFEGRFIDMKFLDSLVSNSVGQNLALALVLLALTALILAWKL